MSDGRVAELVDRAGGDRERGDGSHRDADAGDAAMRITESLCKVLRRIRRRG